MGVSHIKVQVNPDVAPTGSDLAVVNAARRSFGKRSVWYNQRDLDENYYDITSEVQPILKEADKRLIEFLARGMTAGDFDSLVSKLDECVVDGEDEDFDLTKHLLWQWRNTPIHDTPFNHCFISFEIKAPIFVCRQLAKTEYTIISEYSRRYITEDVEFYKHDYREASKDKKQGSGGNHRKSGIWRDKASISNKRQLELYNTMIDSGVAPEQARGQLPLDLMTAWTWSGTLGAFAKMCRERLGSDAQKETRFVAEGVYKYLKEYYPVSAVALVEGV